MFNHIKSKNYLFMVQKIRVIKFQRKLQPRVSLSSSFETREVGHL